MDAITIDKSKAKKKQTIHGTSEDEIIKGSKYADTIYTGVGYDTIYPGKGKDTVIINGKGTKNIYLEPATGNKIIKFDIAEGDNKNSYIVNINLPTPENSKYSELSPYEYIKSGNDLIVKYLYDNGAKYYTQTLTFKDYFNGVNPPNIWDDADDSSKNLGTHLLEDGVTVLGDKKRNFVGTSYDDYIVGTKKADNITTGTRADTIIAGKGNDTITMDDFGKKTIEIANGDGDDTIILDSKIGGIYEANLNLNPLDIFETEKSENDLILYRHYDTGKSVKSEKTILKNYETITNDMFKATVNGNNIAGYTTLTKPKFNLKKASTVEVKNSELTVNGVKTEGEDFYKNNLIVTGSKKDTITTYASNSNIFSGAGNDTIFVNGGNANITA